MLTAESLPSIKKLLKGEMTLTNMYHDNNVGNLAFMVFFEVDNEDEDKTYEILMNETITSLVSYYATADANALRLLTPFMDMETSNLIMAKILDHWNDKVQQYLMVYLTETEPCMEDAGYFFMYLPKNL